MELAQNQLNILWVLLCAGEVLLMQVGFCMLESGLVRTKNSINVAVKNMTDFCFAGLVYFVVGYGLMFGDSAAGWVGITGFALLGEHDAMGIATLIFQLVFCATASTIISGAVAERMSFKAYIAIAVVVSGMIYPLSGHWAWNENGWLYELGFVDFAGSTVVHSTGGWLALAAVLILGPRKGRFDGTAKRLSSAHSLVIATFGVLILFFGWLGFNGGSGLVFDNRVPGILLNTGLAGIAGGIGGMLVSMHRHPYLDLKDLLNGVIGGLVSVTACCHCVSPLEALVIGALGGMIAFWATRLLERFRIDDVVGACAAHGFTGIWGTLAVALFGDLSNADFFPKGYTMLEQLGVQAIGIAVFFLWSFGIGYLVFRTLNGVVPFRVSAEAEHLGLNVAEHGATTEILDLLEDMHEHRNNADFSRKVEADPFTEIGQIADEYNQVIERVALEMLQREEAAKRLELQKTQTESMHREILFSIEYAKRIQHAILPDAATLQKTAREVSIFFRPRDIVSGDFYWYWESSAARYVAVVDCTGHGVPGAFMSLIGTTLLNETMLHGGLTDPAAILEQLDGTLRQTLGQGSRESATSDGMDVGLLRIEPNLLAFAGARLPLYLVQDGEVTLRRGVRRSIGGQVRQMRKKFETLSIPIQPGMNVYLATDGFVDQPNPDGLPFDTKGFRELLETIESEPMEQQAKHLATAFAEHRQDTPQRDDVTVLGLRL